LSGRRQRALSPGEVAYPLRAIFYLVGVQNRVLVFIRWSVSFATHGRGARLITADAADE
jgi:hypothetical protein